MSNTAMQRRVDDLRKKRAQPVLAAGGPGASTPTVSPATVEPTYRGGNGKAIGDALLMSLTAKQMAANTELTTQQARVNKVEADIAEKTGGLRGEAEANKYTEDVEQRDSKPQSDDWKTTSPQHSCRNSSRCGRSYSKQPSNSNAKETQCQRSRKHRPKSEVSKEPKSKAFSSSLLISTESAKRTDKSLTTSPSTEKKSPGGNTLQPRHPGGGKTDRPGER